MQIEEVPIGEIIPYDKNPRKNDKAVDIVAKSISRNIFKLYWFYNAMPIQKECEVCNSIFLVKPSAFDRLKTCSYECRIKWQSLNRQGENNPNWKGGKETMNTGYILEYCPEHPKAHKGKVLQHRLVMEKHIGRYLKDNEHIHHLNHNKKDNRIENLQIISQSDHASLHNLGRPSWIKGKNHSIETRQKMSNLRKGKRLKEYFIIKCLNCQKEMNLMPCYAKKKKYCSHSCQQLKRWRDTRKN